MPTETDLGHALRISTGQLLLLRNEEVEEYVKGLSEQEDACAEVAKLDVADFTEVERGQLERLVQTNAEILENVRTWLTRSTAQMARLRDARNTARAYGTFPPPVPIRSIGA